MKTKINFLALAVSLAIVGCGGGGGGGTSTGSPVGTTPPVTTNPPAADPGTLQLSVATPTYQSGSIQQLAFSTLNEARSTYGVGLVAQNAALDGSGQAHADYVKNRLQAGDYAGVSHTEDPAKPGFTGVNPGDRIAFAKYAASASTEDLSSMIAVDGVQSAPGKVAIDSLLSGPYHRFSLLDGFRDVGFGQSVIRIAGEGGDRVTLVANLGVAQGAQAQAPASDWIGVWPAANATGVLYSFAGESPDPIPVNKGACAGYPVSLQVRAGQTLATTAFTLTETATGAAVNVQLSTAANDANPVQARANSAYIIPYNPLKLATQYTAHFVGSRNGVAIDKTWTFTTRADNVKMIYGCDPS